MITLFLVGEDESRLCEADDMPRTRIGDIDIYYEMSGQGEPLVFINGLGMSVRDWDNQASLFSGHYHVLTFDPRGHGKSDKPPGPYSIELFAADTGELIRFLSLAPAHIVGISMGGMIALQLAVSAPELVRSLVIVNSGPELVLQSDRDRLGRSGLRLLIKAFGMRRTAKYLCKDLFPQPDQSLLRDEVAARWAENDKRAYLESFKAMEDWSVRESLHAIRCPALVVAADHDYTPASFTKKFVSRLPEARLVVVPDSRHLTPLDQPELFNRVLMQFLSERKRKPAA